MRALVFAAALALASVASATGVSVVQPSTKPFGLSGSRVIAEYLKTAAASPAMNVNGSVTPVEFSYTATAETHISTVSFVLLDATVTAAKFGGLAALTNGLAVEIVDADGTTVLADFTDGLGIKTNADFLVLGDADYRIGSGADQVIAIWRIERNFSSIHHLHLFTGQSIRITVRDDLTSIDTFRAMFAGHMETSQ